MDKKVVVHIYNGILLSDKKQWIWVSDGMDELRIYYTEWSESEKDKSHILMCICEIWKNGTEDFIYTAALEKQTYKE